MKNTHKSYRHLLLILVVWPLKGPFITPISLYMTTLRGSLGRISHASSAMVLRRNSSVLKTHAYHLSLLLLFFFGAAGTFGVSGAIVQIAVTIFQFIPCLYSFRSTQQLKYECWPPMNSLARNHDVFAMMSALRPLLAIRWLGIS
jgi:hypothetical protein